MLSTQVAARVGKGNYGQARDAESSAELSAHQQQVCMPNLKDNDTMYRLEYSRLLNLRYSFSKANSHLLRQVQSVLTTLTQLEYNAQCSFFDLQRRFGGAAASA